MIGELTSKVFYGGTKYARSQPTREEIQAITADDLKSFYQTYYKPNGAILGVTGDVNVSALKAKLEAAFGEWKTGDGVAQLPAADFHSKDQSHIYLIDRPGSAQTVIQFQSLGV